MDKAIEIVLAHTPRLPAEDVPLPEALDRILAEDVAADVDLPPFDRAAMDGYAMRAADAARPPVRLAVVGSVRAGQFPDSPVEAGEAMKIMTGAPVPRGATAVQPVEKTRSLDGGRSVEILGNVEPEQNIVRAGTEVRAGNRVLTAGIRLDPAALAVLAAFGKGKVRVGRRPTVSVLVTGDELVDVWDVPRRGQIRNSNGYAVQALVRAAGGVPVSMTVVPDDLDRTAEAIRPALASDVLVLSGGVSAGDYDFVEAALARFDVGLLFTKVAIKPGAPLVFGRRGDKLVFGLPGNPVSAQVTFEIFVRAALLRMQGAAVTARPSLAARLSAPLRNRSGRQAYLPVRLRLENGVPVVDPIRSAGSGDLVAHARANGLAVLEATRLEARDGEMVPVLLVSNSLDRDGAA